MPGQWDHTRTKFGRYISWGLRTCTKFGHTSLGHHRAVAVGSCRGHIFWLAAETIYFGLPNKLLQILSVARWTRRWAKRDIGRNKLPRSSRPEACVAKTCRCREGGTKQGKREREKGEKGRVVTPQLEGGGMALWCSWRAVGLGLLLEPDKFHVER